jgi:glycosyltransferase involved in cell wall biosynthesis
MKVLHALRTGGVAYGVERTVLSMLPDLAKQGVEVHALVVVETRAGGTAGAVPALLREAGCDVDVIGTATRFPFAVVKTLRDICERDAIDIVHTHGYKSDLASLLSRVPARKVATVHGWCSRSTRERFYEWLDVQCQKRMDVVFALCEDYRQRLLRRGVPDRLIRVALAGIDSGRVPSSGRDYRVKWRVGPDDVLAVQIGRLSIEKGPGLFVEVAKRVSQRAPHAKFFLVGDGPMTTWLQSDPAVRSGLVTLTGYVEDIGDVFRAADVIVNCSTTEGLPGALLEAGAASRPVVATDVGGVSEIINHDATGLLCPSGDADALTDALGRIVQDKPLREAMGAAAREHINSVFNTAACARRLVEVYESLLA